MGGNRIVTISFLPPTDVPRQTILDINGFQLTADCTSSASEVRDDSGLVRIALENDAEVSATLSAAGFSSVETHILSVEVDDKPGELLRVAAALAEGKINITTVYGTSVHGAKTSRILIAAQNIDKALAILEALASGAPSPA